MALPGVAAAVERARDALVGLHNHPANRRGWPVTRGGGEPAGGAGVGGAGRRHRSPRADGDGVGPVLAGAVRVAEEQGRLLGVWRTSPLQALARLHVLAAADLVGEPELGRPRTGADVSARLALLADLVTGGTAAPAPVVVAVVHGELLALEPFGSADGVVARAAARLTAVATGLDPKALAVPEVGHLRRQREYREAAAGVRGRDRRRDRGVGAALLRAVGGGRAARGGRSPRPANWR